MVLLILKCDNCVNVFKISVTKTKRNHWTFVETNKYEKKHNCITIYSDNCT